MTNAFSRLTGAVERWSFKYNCYEAVHPWTPFCSDSALDIGVTVFGEAIKLYTPLYLFSQLIQRRYDFASFKNTSQSILRSTTFISANAFFVLFFFCSSKFFTGKFYYYAVAYIPGFIASSMAVLIEKPSRRSSLAFYVANVASEALFRIYVARGYIRPINNGQVYIFTLSIAILMLLAKKNGFEDDPLSTAIRLIVGSEEAAKRRRRNMQQVQQSLPMDGGGRFNDVSDVSMLKGVKTSYDYCTQGRDQQQPSTSYTTPSSSDRCEQQLESSKSSTEWLDTIDADAEADGEALLLHNRATTSHTNPATQFDIDKPELDESSCGLVSSHKQQQKPTTIVSHGQANSRSSSLSRLKSTLNWLKFLLTAKHRLCPHDNCSCIYYVSKSTGRALLIGYAAQLVFKLVPRAQQCLSRPKLIAETITDPGMLRTGLFLSLFTGLFKATNCWLRWSLDTSRPFNSFIAGLVAGPAMFIYPSPTVALYVLWKCLETLFNEAYKNGTITNKEPYVIVLYGLATSQLFYSALMDPRYMKKSYMAFLDRMSHHKLHMVNRFVLDVFGTEASSGYEDFFPDLHPRFMSRAFIGSIWIWMIEQKLQCKQLSSSYKYKQQISDKF